MALDQNAEYPVGTAAATGDYPEGSAVNSTSPGALDGYPWEKEQINDRFGLEQALLRLSGQAASGLPDTALISQYLKGIIELATGRAVNYDESGVADAYVLDVQTDQQAPAGLFDGQRFTCIVGNAPTGASTINVAGQGIVALKNSDGNALTVNYFLAGEKISGGYNLAAGEFWLDRPVGGQYFKISDLQAAGTLGGTALVSAWQTRTFNTEYDPGGIVVLSANTVALQAGVYIIKANAPGYRVNHHRIRLYNVTDTADTGLLSSSELSLLSAQTRSHIYDVLILPVGKTLRIDHWTEAAGATDALGVGIAGPGLQEVFTELEGWKIA